MEEAPSADGGRPSSSLVAEFQVQRQIVIGCAQLSQTGGGATMLGAAPEPPGTSSMTAGTGTPGPPRGAPHGLIVRFWHCLPPGHAAARSPQPMRLRA